MLRTALDIKRWAIVWRYRVWSLLYRGSLQCSALHNSFGGKDVFPRYAIQRVLKGQAIWIKRSSAIQVLKPCPILSVFPSIGVSFSVRDAMNKLIALFPNDPYARYKAAGALGGASKHGCLSLDNNGVWIRIK